MMHSLTGFVFASFFGIDLTLSLYAIIAFTLIGLTLTGLILLTKAKLVSTEKCKLFINNDPSLTREVEGGQTLLLALTSSGIPIPCPCGGKATCKQCRVQVLDQGIQALETDKATFTKKQLKEGFCLSC